MRKFDLEEAKAGKPLVTRGGQDAKFIAHVPEVHQVVVLVGESIWSLCEDGIYGACKNPGALDLFMKPTKRTVYVNVYKSNVMHSGFSTYAYPCEESAKFAALNYGDAVATAVPIEIEE